MFSIQSCVLCCGLFFNGEREVKLCLSKAYQASMFEPLVKGFRRP